MRAFVAALIIGLLAMPAYAQMGGSKGYSGPPGSQPKTEEEKRREAQQEKDYKAALQRIPVKKAVDPWANMR